MVKIVKSNSFSLLTGWEDNRNGKGGMIISAPRI